MKKLALYFNAYTALRIYLALSLILIGVLVLICRNPDPFIHPIIYGEDCWAGLGLSQGWYYALLHARPDYLVMGNIILLWIATQCCMLFFGNPILYLPQSIALVSCFFYSSAAVIAFYIIRNIVPLLFRIALLIFLILMPLGFSQNEIFGRTVQVGYYIPLIAIMLFYLRSRCNGFISRSIIDLFLFLCAATNPIVIGFTLAYIVWDMLQNSNIKNALARNIVLSLSLLALAIYLIPRIMSDHTNRLQGIFDFKQLIEAICARSILFPIIFPWYDKLSDTLSICLLAGWISLIIHAYLRSKNILGKRLILFLSIGLIVTIVATLTMRPGLTVALHKYQTSFPDRYFMGINAIAIFLTVLALGLLAMSTNKLSIFLSWICLGIIVCDYCFHLNCFFEWYSSRFSIIQSASSMTFETQLKAIPIVSDSRLINIPIYPTTWTMEIPVKWIKMAQDRSQAQ